MPEIAADRVASTGAVKAWPTTTARVMSIVAGLGFASSFLATALQYFTVSGVIASLSTLIAILYTFAVPAARPDTGARTDAARLADSRANASGFLVSLQLVVLTLLILNITRSPGEPIVLPAAFMQEAIVILIAPVFIMPFILRVWRRTPKS